MAFPEYLETNILDERHKDFLGYNPKEHITLDDNSTELSFYHPDELWYYHAHVTSTGTYLNTGNNIHNYTTIK